MIIGGDSMDLIEVENKYNTDESCREYIAKIRWKNGYICPRCNNEKSWVTSESKYKCQNCDYKMSVTSGTIFHGSHIPLPTWFQMMWYFSSDNKSTSKNEKSAVYLQKKLKIGSYRTVLSMIKKIKSIMVCDKLDSLSGSIEMMTTDIKILKQTIRIIIAVEVIGRKLGRIRIERINRDSLLDQADFIDRCIDSESIIISDNAHLKRLIYENEYTFKTKQSSYAFSNTNKVMNKLIGTISYLKRIDNIDDYLRTYCIKANNSKHPFTFDEILENAICKV